MSVSFSDLPSNRISPASSGTSPAIMFISVDLPQPLGPKIETILARGKSRLKLVYSGLPAKLLLRPRTVTWVWGAARRVSSESGSPAACGGNTEIGSAPLMRNAPASCRLRARLTRTARRAERRPQEDTSCLSAPVNQLLLDQQEQQIQQIAQRPGDQNRAVHLLDVEHLLRVDDAVAQAVLRADEHLGHDHDNQRHRHRAAQADEGLCQALHQHHVLEH